jgi:uncharacterized membrane protein YfhO
MATQEKKFYYTFGGLGGDDYKTSMSTLASFVMPILFFLLIAINTTQHSAVPCFDNGIVVVHGLLE